jgi:hypothetical protein
MINSIKMKKKKVVFERQPTWPPRPTVTDDTEHLKQTKLISTSDYLSNRNANTAKGKTCEKRKKRSAACCCSDSSSS